MAHGRTTNAYIAPKIFNGERSRLRKLDYNFLKKKLGFANQIELTMSLGNRAKTFVIIDRILKTVDKPGQILAGLLKYVSLCDDGIFKEHYDLAGEGIKSGFIGSLRERFMSKFIVDLEDAISAYKETKPLRNIENKKYIYHVNKIADLVHHHYKNVVKTKTS